MLALPGLKYTLSLADPWDYGPSWGRTPATHVPQAPLGWTYMPLPQTAAAFLRFVPGSSGAAAP